MSDSISVIIPTFNRAQLLRRALLSVLNQTRQPNEIIIIDDGSVDETAELIAREFPAIRYIFQQNQGVSSARNRGIAAASSEWIALLDSDDEWLSEKLHKQMKLLQLERENGTHYRICHTDEIWIRDGKRVNPKVKHQKFGGYIFQKCLPLCVISPSSAIIHKSIFEEIGRFDESLPACEDYDLWLRICARYPVLFLPRPLLVKYGGQADQLSRKFWGMDRFRVQALEKLLDDDHHALSPENRLAVIEMLLKKLNILITGAKKRGNHEILDKYLEKLDYYQNLAQNMSKRHVKKQLN